MKTFSILLQLAGLGAVLYSLWFLLDGTEYQYAQRTAFHHTSALTESIPSETLRPVTVAAIPLPSAEADTRLLGELRIPNVNLDVMVGEGLDKQTLRRAVGHLAVSARPGELGNLVLLGHRDTFFRPLRKLRRGDIAEVRTKAGVFRYRIEVIKIVKPDHVDLKLGTDHATISLVTCYPFYYVGPAPQRFVAQGRLIEHPGK